MKLRTTIISIIFLLAFTLSTATIPMANPTIQSVPETNLNSLATYNILWNTTSDFTNYASNNCTVESGQLSLKKINIAYDFTDDSNGADPSGWYPLFESTNTDITVVNDFDGHNKVVKFYDNNSGGLPWMTQYFDEQTSGKIEFWLQTASGWSGGKILVMPSYTDDYPNSTGVGVAAFHLDIHDNGKVYVSEPGNDTLVGNWTDDTWHHFLLNFNCTARVVGIWFDGVYTGQYNFYSYFSYSQVNQLTLYSWDEMTGSYYLDAVDYSWTSGYFINRSYNYYGQKYYNNCLWESTVQNLGADKPYYNNLTFSGQTTANTSKYISYRLSENGNGWSNWTDWTTSNISFNKNQKQYFQVRILLATNDALQTPVLDWINLSYNK